ncbi:hypothetical protein BDM02DRAFT_3115948 [Thelephora ganbajun]|uniref:Uncharacterized protein n=1 Tax=Thelephora ganbajun TaxID=370292 RepID=A0ACB6ZFE5_THEGA|nr:hypothetical protein BDM02DRAFT_3115948 [Thelephora ganbajun]
MDYYRADLNELNTPNSPSVEELEIEPFGQPITGHRAHSRGSARSGEGGYTPTVPHPLL